MSLYLMTVLKIQMFFFHLGAEGAVNTNDQHTATLLG